MSQFSHLKNETNNIIYLMGLLGELNEIVYTKHVEQYLGPVSAQ